MLFRVALLAALMMAVPTHAERRPVLGQPALPHPYSFREMSLPQLTSGPSSLAWAPDSGELIYSMAGSLWRQKIGASAASGAGAGADAGAGAGPAGGWGDHAGPWGGTR